MKKYKSELINKILEERGHEMSTLHYESECIETWIGENKGSYPKLCDYQSEWLNYINENPLGEFPYETLTDVSTATINNVVPYAYKSAILTGQTLVNLYPVQRIDKVVEENKATDLTGQQSLKIPISNGKKAIFTFNISTPFTSTFTGFCQTLPNWNRANFSITNGKNFIILDTTNNNDDIISFDFYIEDAIVGDYTITDMMVIEYQDGMENWDIPFFTGIQSVKMPVLTTTGKNLFDENRRYEISDKLWFAIPFEKDSYFTFSSFDTIPYIEFYGTTTEFVDKLYGGDGVSWKPLETFSNKESGTFKKESKYNYIIIAFDKANLPNGEDFLKNLQVEQGTQATTHEPYKSNILTVNEDVVLRGVGDVKDELNCLTGEVTQQIGEVVLNGSEDWIFNTVSSNDTITVCNLGIENIKIGGVGISDKLQNSTEAIINSFRLSSTSQTLIVRLDTSFLPSKDVNGFKKYLQKNPITIYYELAKESVKTVDLSVIDHDGNTLSQIKPLEGTMNISTDGTPLKPTVSMEIPVEAITQNLCSFIEEE